MYLNWFKIRSVWIGYQTVPCSLHLSWNKPEFKKTPMISNQDRIHIFSGLTLCFLCSLSTRQSKGLPNKPPMSFQACPPLSPFCRVDSRDYFSHFMDSSWLQNSMHVSPEVSLIGFSEGCFREVLQLQLGEMQVFASERASSNVSRSGGPGLFEKSNVFVTLVGIPRTVSHQLLYLSNALYCQNCKGGGTDVSWVKPRGTCGTGHLFLDRVAVQLLWIQPTSHNPIQVLPPAVSNSKTQVLSATSSCWKAQVQKYQQIPKDCRRLQHDKQGCPSKEEATDYYSYQRFLGCPPYRNARGGEETRLYFGGVHDVGDTLARFPGDETPRYD